MPQKRRSNAADRQGGGTANQTSVARASVQNDVAGVALAVFALALLVALVAPSTAVVAFAVERALTLSFGVGAVLCPIMVFLFSLTFFVEGEEPFGVRAAAGLVLVTVAILALISLFAPGADVDPHVVLTREVAEVAGGYVGGGVAWVALTLVGKWVGLVLLVGLALTGAIICGFSVSAFVVRVRAGAERLSEARETARVQRVQWTQESRRLATAAAGAPAAELAVAPSLADAPGSATFIGARRTSVLTRGAERVRRALRDRKPAPDERGGQTALDLPWDEDVAEPQASAAIMERGNGIPATAERPRESAPLKRRQGGRRAGAGKGDGKTQDVPPAREVPPTAERAQEDEAAGRSKKLKRRPRTAQGDKVGATRSRRQPQGAAGEAPASEVRRARKQAADAAEAAGSAGAAGAVEVPDFLRNPAAPSSVATASGEAPKERAQRKVNKVRKPLASNVHASDEGVTRPGDGAEGYELPSLTMLEASPSAQVSASSAEELEQTRARLQGTLHEFGLTSRVVDYVAGPIVTTFRVEMGEGERVNRIRNLEDDIALTLAAEKVRIFAPIPGTSFVGIEIPNAKRQNVRLGDVLPHAQGGPLEVAIGRDSAGRPVIADIAKMPHMLVAGTTGSGKSVMINSMIMSLLMRTTPKQVRLIMIDPKRVEFSCYNGLPHLYVPVVTEPRQEASALQWAVSEMERRLKVFERAGAREINVYNKMCTTGKLSEMENPPEPMPYLVVIIDELSDLMMVAGKDVEASIVRIAQLARAAGIHLLIATQRPSANVVTGLIKSNIDNRVALKVSSGIDSRVILDETGAERLLGNGDMLFKYRGLNMQRVLGCYTSDAEINEVVGFIRDQAEPDYHEEILSAVVPGQMSVSGAMDAAEEDDPLVWEAAQIVVESRLGSTSGLQRRLKVGYARAGRIMDMLEAKGVVGPPDGSKPREVLLDEDGLEELRVAEAAYREV